MLKGLLKNVAADIRKCFQLMRRDWETYSKRSRHLIRARIVAEILALRMKKPTDGFVLASRVTPVIHWATAGVQWDISGIFGWLRTADCPLTVYSLTQGCYKQYVIANFDFRILNLQVFVKKWYEGFIQIIDWRWRASFQQLEICY